MSRANSEGQAFNNFLIYTTSPLMSTNPWVNASRWAILIALGLIVYYQTFAFGFVFDDDGFIVSNAYIKNLSQLAGQFESMPKTRLVGMYSFALNYLFGGLNPAGYHIVNFLIHILMAGLVWATAGLLFRVTAKATTTTWPFLIALLFVVHPCQTQAVTYISQRFESLAALFYLAAVYCYLKARMEGKPTWFIGTVVAALLGIMTKETVATLPLMLLAVEWLLVPGKKNYKALLGTGAVFLALFVFLIPGGLRGLTAHIPSESHDGDVFTLGTYVMTQLRVFLVFVRLLVFPIEQNLDYDFPASVSLWEPWSTLSGAGVVAVFVILIIRLRRTLPLTAFGLAWMLITFSINLVPRSNAIFEHKLYLISFGFFLVLSTVLAAMIRAPRVLVVVVGALVMVLGYMSMIRNHVWRDEVTLWEDVIKKSPHKERPKVNLAVAYMYTLRYDEALKLLDQAGDLKPQDTKVYITRGEIFYRNRNDLGALSNFNRALELNPKDFETYIRRSKVHKRRGQIDLAQADLDRAIGLNPYNERPYVDRSILWMAQKQPHKAQEDLDRVLRIDPRNYGALVNYAGIYFSQKKYAQAIEYLDRAQKVDPEDFRVYKNRALCRMALGEVKAARQDAQTVLRLIEHDEQMSALLALK